jgi:hypothetical protein
MLGLGIFAHTGFIPATASLAAPAVSAIKSRRRIRYPDVSPETIAGAQVWEPAQVGCGRPKDEPEHRGPECFNRAANTLWNVRLCPTPDMLRLPPQQQTQCPRSNSTTKAHPTFQNPRPARFPISATYPSKIRDVFLPLK